MPWQRQVADVGLELLDDGTPAYREVSFTVPRQSGKTTLILGWEVQRALGWDGPQRIVYSAQTGNDSRKKLVEDQFPALEKHRKLLGIRQLLRGMGNEGVVWNNGSRLVVLASSEDSGHGKTVDLGVKDEYFADQDDRRDQALIPAMSTRRFAQLLTASTAGTDSSVPLNRLMAKGRQAVDAGSTEGIAYFEWSADPNDDIDSPLVWARCMPALGHTISEQVVAHARSTMTESEFRRAFLNIPTTSTQDRVWSPAQWSAVNGLLDAPSAPFFVGVDAKPDRSAASIAIAGGGVVEVLVPRPTIGNVASYAVKIAKDTGATVAIDPSGPAAFILPDLESAGVEVLKVSGQMMGQACGAVFTAVNEGAIRFRKHPDLDAAVAGARTVPKGDVWVWARKDSSVDVSPLVAATLAWWASSQAVALVPEVRFTNLADLLDEDDWDD